MRVIAGKYKGRKLTAPPGKEVRPTSDKVKEALFSMLTSLAAPGAEGGGAFAGKTCLDLFAGTGALGIESLSRGAESCVFVEAHPVAAAVLKNNIESVVGDELRRASVIRADWRLALRRLKKQADIVFVDPPYEAGYCDEVMKTLLDCDIISGSGFVALERAMEGKDYRAVAGRRARGGARGIDFTEEDPLAGRYCGFALVRERRYGKTFIEIYRRTYRPL